MRHFELMTCVVAGLFTRPENYVALNRRLEHALDDRADAKRASPGESQPSKGRPRPN